MILPVCERRGVRYGQPVGRGQIRIFLQLKTSGGRRPRKDHVGAGGRNAQRRRGQGNLKYRAGQIGRRKNVRAALDGDEAEILPGRGRRVDRDGKDDVAVGFKGQQNAVNVRKERVRVRREMAGRLIDEIELDVVQEQIIGQARVDQRAGEEELVAPGT